MRVLLERLAVNLLYRLIVYDACIRVIDSTVTTNEQLRRLIIIDLALEKFTEFVIRLDDTGDAFRGVKASDLYNLKWTSVRVLLALYCQRKLTYSLAGHFNSLDRSLAQRALNSPM